MYSRCIQASVVLSALLSKVKKLVDLEVTCKSPGKSNIEFMFRASRAACSTTLWSTLC